MKIDAKCKDGAGNETIVSVDIDYVDLSSYDAVHDWCENEIYSKGIDFDILDFTVVNYEDIYYDWRAEQEEDLVPDIPEDYCLDPISPQEII